MPKKITVVAVAGVLVPRELSGREQVIADQPTEVEDSVYYRRRLADGDLQIVDTKTAPKKPVKPKEVKNGK